MVVKQISNYDLTSDVGLRHGLKHVQLYMHANITNKLYIFTLPSLRMQIVLIDVQL